MFLHLEALFLTVAILGGGILLYYVAIENEYRRDVSSQANNTISEQSIAILKKMPETIMVKAYVGKNSSIRQAVETVIDGYKQHKKNIELHFINPELVPKEVRDNGIQREGEMIISYGQRSRHITNPRENEITNALIKMHNQERKILAFIGGHGERYINGKANFDWGDYGNYLRQNGYTTQLLDLSTTPFIADNVAVLIIGGPRFEMLPGEIKIIQQYVENGGNILICVDPKDINGVDLIAERLGIGIIPGTVQDPNIKAIYNFPDTRVGAVVQYPSHPITRTLSQVTIFPEMAALEIVAKDRYEYRSILKTLPQTWLKPEEKNFDRDRVRKGAFNIGYAIESKGDVKKQRAVIIGDSDFLSNQYIGNGSNMELGAKIVNWLIFDDKRVNIPKSYAKDSHLKMSYWFKVLISLGYKLLLPLLFLLTGFLIWFIRKRR